MYEELFRKRLIELRMEKGVSARDMSLSLGQSAGYINRIENQQMLPSMTAFFYICEYFQIEPQNFFCDSDVNSLELLDIIHDLEQLDETKRQHIASVIKDLKNSLP